MQVLFGVKLDRVIGSFVANSAEENVSVSGLKLRESVPKGGGPYQMIRLLKLAWQPAIVQ